MITLSGFSSYFGFCAPSKFKSCANYRLIISIVLDNVERASIFTEVTEEKPSALKRHADGTA